MKKKCANIILLCLISMLSHACLRTAESPRDYANGQIEDKLLGKLLREIGPCEVDILLAAPTVEFASEYSYSERCNREILLSGLTTQELLYLLDRLPLDTIIELIRGIGAERTVRLIKAIRRFGCNYEIINPSQHITPYLSQQEIEQRCPYSQFAYLDFLVNVISRIPNPTRLVSAINQNLLPGATKAIQGVFVETIAFLLVHLDRRDPNQGIEKLTNLINNTLDPRDVGHLVNAFALEVQAEVDTELVGQNCDGQIIPNGNLANPHPSLTEKRNRELYYIPASCTNPPHETPSRFAANNSDFVSLKRLVITLERIPDPNKIFPLLDGERSTIPPGSDTEQRDYLENRLIPVLKGPNCGADNAPGGGDDQFAYGIPASSNVPAAYCIGSSLSLTGDEWVDRLILLIEEIPDILKIRNLVREISSSQIPKLIEVVARVDFAGTSPINTPPAGYAASPCNSGSTAWDPYFKNNPSNAIRSLAYLVNNVTNQNKVISLMENVVDAARLAQVMDDVAYTSVVADDQTTCRLTAGGEKMGNILETISLAKIPILASVVSEVTNVAKVSFLVNYLTITHAYKMGAVVENLTNANNLLEIFNADGPVGPSNTKELDDPNFPTTQNGAVRTVAFVIDNIVTVATMSELVNLAAPDNLTDLLNDVASGSGCSAVDCPAGKKLVKIINNTEETPDIVFLLANISQIAKISDVINALPVGTWPIPLDPFNPGYYDGAGKMALLINTVAGRCSIATRYYRSECITHGGTWNATYEGGNLWNPNVGQRYTAQEMGKIVNLVDYGPPAATLAQLIVNTNDIIKMGILINRITNSSNLVALVTKVVGGPVQGGKIPYTDIQDLTDLINHSLLQRSDMRKLAAVIDRAGGNATETAMLPCNPCITPHPNQTLIAELMGKYENFPGNPNLLTFLNQGIGADLLAALVVNLSETDNNTDGYPDSAENLGTLLANLNTTLNYNSTAISKKDALIRLLLVNPTGNNQTFRPNAYTLPDPDIFFPAIGPYHLSLILNNVAQSNTLITLMNGINIMDALVTIGCLDRVGDYNGDGFWDGNTIVVSGKIFPNPNFETPCKDSPGSLW